MTKIKSNPEWTDELTEQFCDTIKRCALKHSLPMPDLSRNCRIPDSDFLGEGVYGAVYTTDSPDCVFKLTTDSSEAHFAATAIKLRREKGVDPHGVVDTRAVFAIPAKHDGFDVFLLWREYAEETGLPEKSKSCEMRRFMDMLTAFYVASDEAFRIAFDEQRSNPDYFKWLHDRVQLSNAILSGKKPKYSSKFSELVVDCYELADELMSAGSKSFYVGEALRMYLENGILLCDVHANNVGLVKRGDCGSTIWCLVDTGHALILKKTLSEISIPILKSEGE